MKKCFGLLMAAALILGPAVAYAAELPPVVTAGVSGVNTAGFTEMLDYVAIKHETANISGAGLSALVVEPGDKITIQLAAQMFLDQDGSPFEGGQNEEHPEQSGNPVRNISLSALRSGDITLRTARGGNMAEIALAGDSGGSRIEITFSDSITRIGDDFEIEVYLVHDGDRVDETRIDIIGTVETEIYTASVDEDSFDTSDGSGVEASESVRNITFELGNNVTVTRNLSRGKICYGVCTTELLERDNLIIDKYPGVAEIYRLQTSGLKTTGNIVRFDLGDTYHVYNTYGLYLGTTGSALPYWTTYYLSEQQYEYLDIP
jgi:hypothetical protein